MLRRQPTPNEVRDGAHKEIGATSLHASTIRIVVYMAHGLPGAKAAQYEILAIGMDDVHKLRIAAVQTHLRMLRLEEWPGRIESSDA